MAISDGPISQGIRDAIKAYKMTPYKIAQEVTKTGVKLTGPQIYRFLNGKSGLSMAILDKIAVVLDLVVQNKSTTTILEPKLEPEALAQEQSEPVPVKVLSPAALARRAERRAQRKDLLRRKRAIQNDPDTKKLKDMIASLRAEDEDDEDDPFAAYDATKKATPPPPPVSRAPADNDEDDEDKKSWLNYQDVPQDFARNRTIGNIDARQMLRSIQSIAQDISNPGMRKLAEMYALGAGNGLGKAKFYRFISQLMRNNTLKETILAMPDLANRFKEIALIVPDPENMGRLGDTIKPKDLYPESENPEGFFKNIESLLRSQGIIDGVKKLSPAALARKAQRREMLRKKREMENDPDTKEMRDILANMIKSRTRENDPFADDDAEEAAKKAAPPPPPLSRAPADENDEDKSFDNYEYVPQDFARERGIGSIDARQMTRSIKSIAPDIKNPGMRELADKYASGKGSTGLEKAKFYRFISQLMRNNADKEKLLAMPDLVDRFHDIALITPYPENLGRIGDVIKPEQLYPASERFEEFYNDMDNILRSQGIIKGVKKPPKRKRTS